MSWFWLPGARGDRETYVLARCVVDLADDTTVGIAADGRFVAWCNGARIAQGPGRSRPDALPVEQVVLPAGRNIIAIAARWYQRATLYWLPGATERGGIWFDGPTAQRRVRPAPYATHEPDPFQGAPDPEWIDGRAWPHGWLSANFDDTSWEMAVAVTGAPPVASALPPLAETIIDVGTFTGSDEQTFDIGRLTNGFLSVEVDAAPGVEVELRCGEEVDEAGVPLSERLWSLRYRAAGIQGESAESFEPMGFRYVRVGARGGAVRSARVVARQRIYPREDQAFFRSSDPTLEQIYAAGARALDLCSTDAFIDCPSREQRAWIGDDIVNTMVSLTVSDDLRLVEHDLRLHAAGQREDGLLPMVAAGDFSQREHTLPDGNLHWVRALARLSAYRGEYAADLVAVAKRILDAFEARRGPDGLLAGWTPGVTGWVFIDWAQMQRDSSMSVMDALYGIALTDHAAMCDGLGDDAGAARARARAEQTRVAAQRYWDDERGVFVDATTRVSQQANAAAIVAGWADDAQTARIIERITDPARLRVTKTPGDGGTLFERLAYQFEDPTDFDDREHVVAAQPYFMHLLHEAFARAGRHDLLLPSIARWLPMVERSGTVEEYWDALPGLGSRCHAWSATPTHDLVRYILGARVAGRTLHIAPNLGGLDWAQARFPTVAGWATVRAGASGTLIIDAPPDLIVTSG